MESVSCCYHDDNPAMSNECGAQLSDALGWRSLNKQAWSQGGGRRRNRGTRERRQGTDGTLSSRFLLRFFFPSWNQRSKTLDERNITNQSTIFQCFPLGGLAFDLLS